MNRENNLTEEKILGFLIRFVVPVFIALFLQALYGVVDLFVVGWFADNADITGVSIGSLITQSLYLNGFVAPTVPANVPAVEIIFPHASYAFQQPFSLSYHIFPLYLRKYSFHKYSMLYHT